jgi:anti-sigma B factor antagonist
MNGQSLAFQDAREAGGTHLAVAGEIDMTTADSLYERATGLVGQGVGVLVLDFGGVTFCDSLGLAALVRIYRHSTAHGCHLRLTNLHEHVAHVVHISGLDRVVEVEADPT